MGVARAEWPGVDWSVTQRVLGAFVRREFPIVIAGDTGTGKSCLAALIWQLAIQDGARRPIFAEASALLGAIIATRTSESKTATISTPFGEPQECSETQIYSWIEAAPVMVLDDLGMRELSEAQQDALIRVLNLRCNRALIVTTNLNAKELAPVIGQRAYSRLLAGAKFRLDGSDRRVAR